MRRDCGFKESNIIVRDSRIRGSSKRIKDDDATDDMDNSSDDDLTRSLIPPKKTVLHSGDNKSRRWYRGRTALTSTEVFMCEPN